MKPGGTEGGVAEFKGGIGVIVAATALYLFFDSVHVGAHGAGLMAGYLGLGSTTSAGLIFLPFIIGVAMMFYDSSSRLGAALFWGGLGVIAVEILSRVRFSFDMKTSHLLLVLAMFGAGVGLILRSFRDGSGKSG